MMPSLLRSLNVHLTLQIHQDNEKCDVWSIGVIAYMLLSGCPPFSGTDNLDTLNKVRRGKFSFDEQYFDRVSGVAKVGE
jgi:calcium-dependent protein kinase